MFTGISLKFNFFSSLLFVFDLVGDAFGHGASVSLRAVLLCFPRCCPADSRKGASPARAIHPQTPCHMSAGSSPVFHWACLYFCYQLVEVLKVFWTEVPCLHFLLSLMLLQASARFVPSPWSLVPSPRWSNSAFRANARMSHPGKLCLLESHEGFIFF